jgi:hypothetical protein
MVNKPRNIGTAFTTSVVRYLRDHGFAPAELRNLAGRYDLGDIVGLPGVVIECKGGRAAESAGAGLLDDWLDETETERSNARAEVGLLVVKRKGAGALRVGTHRAYFPLWQVLMLSGGYGAHIGADLRHVPVQMALSDAVWLLRACGYGDPLSETARAQVTS